MEKDSREVRKGAFLPAVWGLLAVLISLGIGLGITWILEWGAGRRLYATHRNAGLIWGPYSVVEHATEEYSYQARINNLGFRDRDFPVRRSSAKRVLAIGDSFTYGWGVDAENSWPKVMERELRQGGLDIEIANLGAPGAGPREYAALAGKAIPLLKPDLIVVGMLQADDLFQAADSPAEQPAPAGQRVLRAFRAFYPNMMQMLSPVDTKQVHVSKEELREMWKKQVKDFLGQMTAAEKARFENLPSGVRAAYQAGVLNPGLLYMAMRHGEFLIETCDGGSKAQKGIAETAKELARMRQYAEQAHAGLLVVPVPYRAYVSRRDQEAMLQLGFHVEEAMLTWSAPDEAIHQACRAAQVPFASVTGEFRERGRANDLYFAWDGHLNKAGHAAFGELAGRIVGTKFAGR
ncbi:MAG: GDSL-type esterase/lipase family protein [Candidatus Solibacter sp.]|jgi:lysophospholipase L1-like esterase